MNASSVGGSIEAPGDQSVVGPDGFEHLGVGHLDSGLSGEQMAKVLPQFDIIVVAPRRKLGHAQCAVKVCDTGFGTCSSQRGAGLNKLRDPFLFGQCIASFTLFDGAARRLQSSNVGQGRDFEHRIAVDKIRIGRLFEAESPHARIIVDAQKVIEGGKSTQRSPLFLGLELFSAIQQRASPSVGQCVGEASENIAVGGSVLHAGVIIEIGTQK